MDKEQVNHPDHYNHYPMEVIEMMLKIFGREATYHFCILNAFKYRMRMGLKDSVTLITDIKKEAWYLKMAAVYKLPEVESGVVNEKSYDGTYPIDK